MYSWKGLNYIVLFQVCGCIFVSGEFVCPASMDIVFLLDGSSSIGSSNFVHLKEFIAKVIQHFRVSTTGNGEASVSTDSHIGAVLYSDNASVHVSFNNVQDKAVVADTIRKIPYNGGNTYTNRGLDMARSLFTTARGGRLNVPRALVVINDGKSSASVVTSATNIKNDGIQILAVGIGNAVSMIELHQMASSPDHVYTYVSAFSTLSYSSDIGRAICAVSRRPQLFFTSIAEKTIMVGHVITKFYVTNDMECAFKCLTNQVCFSFNYMESPRMCQLNYSNRKAHPNDVIADDGSIHYDMSFSL